MVRVTRPGTSMLGDNLNNTVKISIVIILFVCVVIGFIYFVFSLLKGSDINKMSVSMIMNNSQVIKLIGTPMHQGMLVTGKIKLSNDDGSADISGSIVGSTGSVDYRVRGIKSAGLWRIQSLIVTHDGTKIEIDPMAVE